MGVYLGLSKAMQLSVKVELRIKLPSKSYPTTLKGSHAPCGKESAPSGSLAAG